MYKLLKFKTEDFLNTSDLEYSVAWIAAERTAKKAQELFNAWLAEQPRISGLCPDHPHWSYEMEWYGMPTMTHTHVARIVDIQSIEPTEEKK